MLKMLTATCDFRIMNMMPRVFPASCKNPFIIAAVDIELAGP